MPRKIDRRRACHLTSIYGSKSSEGFPEDKDGFGGFGGLV